MKSSINIGDNNSEFHDIDENFNLDITEDTSNNIRNIISGDYIQNDIPVVNNNDIERICNLNVSEVEMSLLGGISGIYNVYEILASLSGRNFEKILPINEDNFMYRRYIEECNKLKHSAYYIMDNMNNFSKDSIHFKNASKLLALQLRCSDWLNSEYYPKVYEKIVNSAKGEVNQSLIYEKNVETLDKIVDNSDTDILLLDDLTYLLNGNSHDSSGTYSQGKVSVRIPFHFGEKDEWKVFHVCVHELLHNASYQDHMRIGVQRYSDKYNMEEINEAITETMTYFILKNHQDKNKTFIHGQGTKSVQLSDGAYKEYTTILRDITKKIPFSYFKDAMLNQWGLEKLKIKFDEELGEGSLQNFSHNLKRY